MQRAYLDNAATTPLHPQVKQTIAEAMDFYANPSSLHHLGAEVEKLLGRARAQVAGLLHVSPAGIIFTSGGTEANNLAIKGVLARSRRRGRILTSAIEHPSVLEVFRRLELEGWDVRRIPVDSRGRIMLDALEAALKEPAALVSIMAVNNEIGAVQPLDEAVTLIRSLQPQALIHVDGVQAPGKIEFDAEKLGVDMVSISAHKIHGPKGVGALYARRRDLLLPLLEGGGQEGGLRSGTENVLGILGFGQAAGLIRENLSADVQRVTQLRERLVAGLQDLPCRIISPPGGVPHILAASFPGFRGEVLLQALSGYGVYVSTGAACSGKKGNLSHVAEALGLDQETRTGLLRFSLSAFNTGAEIDYALARIGEVLDELAFVRGRRGH
ncbi:MAG: cysteine desulfurase family protein [Bacillota bacterium]|jgi:cysteine desulfurase